MRNIDLPIVRELALFKNMSNKNFHAVVRSACLQSFAAHVDLISEGDAADFLYVLIEGCVELSAHCNGRKSIISLVRPEGTFILADVVAETHYLMSARTYTQAKILVLPASNVRTAVAIDPSFARAIMIEMTTNYRAAVRSLKDIKLRTGRERLVNYLLAYHEAQGANGVAKLPCEKRTLASLLAMKPESLSRALNALQAYGVDVDGSTIHLNDIEALMKLAKPDRLIEDWITETTVCTERAGRTRE